MSTAPKLTPWFSASVKPARPGVYETRTPTNNRFSYWSGRQWKPEQHSVRGAATTAVGRYQPAAWQDKEWRGLAEPAK